MSSYYDVYRTKTKTKGTKIMDWLFDKNETQIQRFEDAIQYKLWDYFIDGDHKGQVFAKTELEAYKLACEEMDGHISYDPELVGVEPFSKD